jgi:hypothetical protein
MKIFGITQYGVCYNKERQLDVLELDALQLDTSQNTLEILNCFAQANLQWRSGSPIQILSRSLRGRQ